MNWQRFFFRREKDAELARELDAHLAHQIDENLAAGMPDAEARRQAHLQLGSTSRIQEDVREWNTLRWVETLLQDLRYSFRTLRRMPGFALVALFTLALGSGATTVMFTVINGVLLRPLPYTEPDKLVTLQEKTEQATQFGNLWALSYPNFLDCRQQNHSLTMAAWRNDGGTVSGPGEAEYVQGFQISSELFSVLGNGIMYGRAFLPEEDKLGAAPVAIISHNLWQKRYGGNLAALGMKIIFAERSYTITGITSPDFRLIGDEGDIFTPIGQDTTPAMQNRSRHPGIGVVARLHDGVTPAQAQGELNLIGHQLETQYPDSNAGRTFIMQPLRIDMGDTGSTLWLLLGAVSLVLVIACANVANLLLARGVSREREFAIRVALGADRSRVMRQCLTESATLGLIGGALGIVLAMAGIHPFVRFWPGSLPRAEEVHLDWHVLLFAVAVSLLSGLLFGLAPALRIPTRSIERTLRASGRTATGNSRRLHAGFVISEITLAVVLLVSAGILARTLFRLSALNPGVDVHNVLVSRVALSQATLANPGQTRAVWNEIIDRARQVPGVESVAVVDTVPMRQGYNQISYWTTPSFPAPDQMPLALSTSVTSDYLKVMGMPLLKGRFFDDRDRLGSAPVVIIDDVFAKAAFGTQEPVGKSLWVPASFSPFVSNPNASNSGMSNSSSPNPDAPVPVLVVGVVGHVRHWGPAQDDQSRLRAQLYYSFAQLSDTLVPRWSELMSLVVRTNISPLNITDPLQRAVRAANGNEVIYEVSTLEQLAGASLARQRFLLLLFGIFAGLALLLACVGIYGVLAYLTSRRIPEFGIRIAMGASANHVKWLVLRQSMSMVMAGVLLGTAAALAAARMLEHLVPGVRSAEPVAFGAMTLVLLLAAFLASFIPAYRAGKVEPMRALRQD